MSSPVKFAHDDDTKRGHYQLKMPAAILYIKLEAFPRFTIPFASVILERRDSGGEEGRNNDR